MTVYKSKFKNGKVKVISEVKTPAQLKKYLADKVKRARAREAHKRIAQKFKGVL